MEDYIFLIIAVVISIFAAINKNQKNKLADQSPEQEEEEAYEIKRRNYLMDQLLGEDFLEEKEEMEKPAPQVKPTPTKVIFKTSDEARTGLNYKLPKFRSTLPDRPKHVSIVSTPRKKVVEELQEEPEATSDFMEDFSLRKAVVYSIILEPKYEMESQTRII